jgi:hypothetical protein
MVPIVPDGYNVVPPDWKSGDGIPGDVLPPPPCETTADCPVGMVCDPESNVCVECLEAADCHGEGMVCIDNHCVQLLPCDPENPCPEGKLCDPKLGVCVDCLEDADCPDGFECDDGFCEEKKPFCDEENPCPDGLYCNFHTNECVECLGDENCEVTEWCDVEEGECQNDLCKPGERVCVAGGWKECEENGSGYGDTVPCPEGTLCQDGECIPVELCVPGLAYCVSPVSYKQCSQDGTEWFFIECLPGEACMDTEDAHAQCLGVCEPDCSFLKPNYCGMDAAECGIVCDECQNGFECPEGVTGLPGGIPIDCQPSCTCENKECGFNACGDYCGDCPVGYACQAGWCIYSGYTCQEGYDCVMGCMAWGDDGEACINECLGGTAPQYQWLLIELVDCLIAYCGGFLDPWCAEEAAKLQCEKYAQECLTCQSDCFGKECGDDGCGGDCGWCPDGFVCQDYKCMGLGGCKEIVTCVENSEAPPDVSIPMCMAAATPEAQALFLDLAACVQDFCGGFEPYTNCYWMTITGPCSNLYDQCMLCVPSCFGKECGPDGCGGWCAFCPDGAECEDGKCTCIPDCFGMECGPDGCGNVCGMCQDGFECTEYGKCFCVPDCVAKECGDDGCGGLCGYCKPQTEYCTDNGNCLTYNCQPGATDCDGNMVVVCAADGQSWQKQGPCPPGNYCKEGKCLPWVCEPGETQCVGNGVVTCADNGAGWLPVVLCPTGTLCKGGECLPSAGCGDIPQIGCCDGDTLKVCLDGMISVEECGAMGLSCGWIPNWGYGCGGQGADPNGQFPLACPGSCQPECENKECGSDGCGGLCGACQPGATCVDGACEIICVPQCKGLECGNDGCGGVCGVCAPNELCLNGNCFVPSTCKQMLDCAQGCFLLGEACFGMCAANADQSSVDYKEFKTLWNCVTTACAAASDPDCYKKALNGACYQPFLACVSCTPACAGKQCGPDGCGGTCGACKDGYSCENGQCKQVCVPQCASADGTVKECGDNGCGGQCGICKTGWECKAGKCEYICVPQCAGKQCGPDGCGSTCGTCPAGYECSVQGQCLSSAVCGDGFCDKDAGETPYNCPKDCGMPSNGCEPTPFPGCGGCLCESCVCQQDPFCCEVNWDDLCVMLCQECGGCCEANCVNKECGPDSCGGTCGTCPKGEECSPFGVCEVVCKPDCDGKQCGPDDCGGTCGTCPANAMCKDYKCFTGQSCAQLIDCGMDCVMDMGAQCLYGCLEQGTPEAQAKFFDLIECVLFECGLNLSPDCMLGAMQGSCQDEYNACVNCTPNCTNKQCGPNGCGGQCGKCPAGTYCDNYKCKTICTPNCTGKVCGDNGCGGSCGTCPDKQECKSGKCVPICVPNCKGKECGPDGCGGICAFCPNGMICSPQGICTPAGPVCGDGLCQGEGNESCLTCPEDCGKCTGDCCQAHQTVGCQDPNVTACVCGMDPYCCQVMWDGICVDEAKNQCKAQCGCTPNCWGKQCGSDGCGGSCGKCLPTESCSAAGQCVPFCTPNCKGKQCGSDGCGGSCGKCPEGFKCDAGACVPVCTPNCTGKKCGPDGCNGICGLCGPDEVCLSGQCQTAWDCETLLNCLWDCPENDEACYDNCWKNASPEAQEQYIMVWECILDVCGPEPQEPCPGQAILVGQCKDEFNACLDCTPTCTGKQCGPDGCDGSCGQCPPGYTCSVYGYCNCVPNCSGKDCGNDGCGGSCGECSGSYQCNLYGKCVCVPSCTGKECGSNGCGGTCGQCPVGFQCSGNKCIPACQPQCWSPDGQIKQCGPDGCGGQCGYCPPGLICTPEGQCIQSGPVCGDKQCDYPENCLTCSQDCGVCQGDCCTAHETVGCSDLAVTKCVCAMDSFCCEVSWDNLCVQEAKEQCNAKCACVPSCAGKQCGDDGCGGMCGVCAPNAYCNAQGQCIVFCQPQCQGKECGPDGCNGSCGTCKTGYQCNAQGKCICTPNCMNKDCGSDGCGGSCGECGQFQTCTPSGKCKYVTPLCGDGNCLSWIGEDCDVCPQDCGQCCGNGICEPKFQETCATCTADCGTCCGNGFCDVQYGEACETCPQDCGPCAAKCGDGKCEAAKGETCTNCPGDCGACPSTCGDGKCDKATESCTSCPKDCGACSGSCCTSHPTPGCSDQKVQACVCAMDIFCCTQQWDGMCASEADQCGSCNGSCCTAHGNPGCDDEAIEECVCQGDDYCCTAKWDASCVTMVEKYGCGSCQTNPFCGDGVCAGIENCYTCAKDCGQCCGNGMCEPQYAESCQSCALDCGVCPGQGSCCTAHKTPGCNDPDIQDCVCAMDPFCCNNYWDEGCAANADYCGSCNGDCCSANWTPGCEDEQVESCVCSMFPECCDSTWDDWCVMMVDQTGCGWCGCIPSCEGKECGDDGCGGSCGECPPGTECTDEGLCWGQQGDSCSEILSCTTGCGSQWQCIMSCYQNGDPQSQALFMQLLNCVMIDAGCGFPPKAQCMLMAFMTTCSAEYNECAAN